MQSSIKVTKSINCMHFCANKCSLYFFSKPQNSSAAQKSQANNSNGFYQHSIIIFTIIFHNIVKLTKKSVKPYQPFSNNWDFPSIRFINLFYTQRKDLNLATKVGILAIFLFLLHTSVIVCRDGLLN